MNKFNILAGVVGIIATFTGYLFFNNQITSFINVGTELPDAPALFETSLASPITATADSFTLTSNSVRGGGSLSGYNCFTIDEGSAQAEFVCGTASSTSVTGVTRGISPSDGTSAVAALQFAHRRGASVKITDFPIIQILRNQNNGEATFENALRYAASVVPSSADELADVGYVLSVVSGGTVTFDGLVVSGTAGDTLSTSTLVYFATTTQRWNKVDTDDTNTFQNVAIGLTRGAGTNGTAIGGGGVLLKGLQTGLSGQTAGATYYASSSAGTFSTATSVLPIGIAKSTTELQFDPVMLSIPRLGFNNTWTGTNTFTGVASFGVGITGHASTSLQVYTASTTWTKPSSFEYIEVWLCAGGGGGGGNTAADEDAAGGGGGGCAYELLTESELTATSTVTVTVGAGGVAGSAAGGTGGTGSPSSFSSFLSATGGGGGTSNASGGGGGDGTGGDLNLKGNGGGGSTNDTGAGSSGHGGGSALFGGGAQGLKATSAGVDGGNYGGGGGGASHTSGDASDRAGGVGGQGVVIVKTYF